MSRKTSFYILPAVPLERLCRVQTAPPTLTSTRWVTCLDCTMSRHQSSAPSGLPSQLLLLLTHMLITHQWMTCILLHISDRKLTVISKLKATSLSSKSENLHVWQENQDITAQWSPIFLYQGPVRKVTPWLVQRSPVSLCQEPRHDIACHGVRPSVTSKVRNSSRTSFAVRASQSWSVAPRHASSASS
jgi:hypothetical protein